MNTFFVLVQSIWVGRLGEGGGGRGMGCGATIPKPTRPQVADSLKFLLVYRTATNKA